MYYYYPENTETVLFWKKGFFVSIYIYQVVAKFQTVHEYISLFEFV